jgi:hypothetical protein
MYEQARSPLPIKGLAAPLLRPLPTVLTYVKLTANAGNGGSTAGRRLFSINLRAFKAILIALTRSARISEEKIRPLLNRCRDLQEAGFWDLSDLLTGFIAELQGLHQENGSILKETAKKEDKRLGKLYRAETGPTRLVAVFNDQTWAGADKLMAKLVDGCWYDCESRHEHEGLNLFDEKDLILIVSGEAAVRPDIEQAVQQAQLPALVLKDAGPAKQPQNMAALRTEHLYRQGGHRVLRGPFANIRLYQAIDACLVRHLLGKKVALPSLEAVTS